MLNQIKKQRFSMINTHKNKFKLIFKIWKRLKIKINN